MLDSARFTIFDLNGEARQVNVATESKGLVLFIPGYGDFDSEAGDGTPVLLEFRHGVPHLVVWADINNQEPTSVISLARAAESCRNDPDIVSVGPRPVHSPAENRCV